VTIDSAALLSELKADPKQLGYRAAGSPATIAALLNTVGLSGETCANTAVSMDEVMIVLDLDEWDALIQSRRDFLIRVSYLASIDLSNAAVMAQLNKIFPSTTKTAQALNTMVTRPCTRAEALFGGGTVVTADDVVSACALNGGIL